MTNTERAPMDTFLTGLSMVMWLIGRMPLIAIPFLIWLLFAIFTRR